MSARKPKKTRPTTKTSNITAQLRKGTYATGQKWQKELKEFFGTKGRPLKHKLRSEKARQRFNELVHRYNVERPTMAKQKERQAAIREKQKSTVETNVPKKVAKQAVEEYERMVDVLQTVHDDIMSNIKYAEILGMMHEDETLSPKDISDFITKAYNDLQQSLPSWATKEGKPKQLGKEFSDKLTKIILDMNTYNMDDLVEGINAMVAGEDAYKEFLAARNHEQETIKPKGKGATKAGKDRGAGSTRNRKKPGKTGKRK